MTLFSVVYVYSLLINPVDIFISINKHSIFQFWWCFAYLLKFPHQFIFPIIGIYSSLNCCNCLFIFRTLLFPEIILFFIKNKNKYRNTQAKNHHRFLNTYNTFVHGEQLLIWTYLMYLRIGRYLTISEKHVITSFVKKLLECLI